MGDIADLASARPRAIERQGLDLARLSEGPSPNELFSPTNLPILLGRPLRAIPTAAGAEQLTGARVLVTGAAGSVGSALIARLLALAPELVVATDIHEASLFRLAREAPAGAPFDPRVVDIRNETKLRRVFAEVRPRIVFHLAAYKHVPFGEREADEPVSVNVVGTANVVRASADASVAHLVYPSSDKAVNPPSVYGGTKRLAEALLLAHAAASPDPAIHVVRYVNILGSSGSVLETFAAQIAAGSPLTLTDPSMTRYWMAMDEAVDLLIHALGLPSGSRTLLDAGNSTPVKDMAARLFRLLRGDGTPEFVVTGARPGERLAEELSSASEWLTSQGDEGVLNVASERIHTRAEADPMLREIMRLLADGDPGPLRTRLMDLAWSLQ